MDRAHAILDLFNRGTSHRKLTWKTTGKNLKDWKLPLDGNAFRSCQEAIDQYDPSGAPKWIKNPPTLPSLDWAVHKRAAPADDGGRDVLPTKKRPRNEGN